MNFSFKFVISKSLSKFKRMWNKNNETKKNEKGIEAIRKKKSHEGEIYFQSFFFFSKETSEIHAGKRATVSPSKRND